MDPADYAELIADPLEYFDHAEPEVRRLAVAATCALPSSATISRALLDTLSTDPSPRVRAEAAEALSAHGATVADLVAFGSDDEAIVREAAATALGEVGDAAGVPWLISAVESDPDRLVQEAAVAALGAIGDPAAVDVLLRTVSAGGPQLRRRAVVALTAFDGPAVEAALHTAAQDRNPMVREAAEMVVGRASTWTPVDFTGE